VIKKLTKSQFSPTHTRQLKEDNGRTKT